MTKAQTKNEAARIMDYITAEVGPHEPFSMVEVVRATTCTVVWMGTVCRAWARYSEGRGEIVRVARGVWEWRP